jgi:hypothetical protein
MTEDFCLLTRRFCFLSTVPPPWKLISTSEAKTLEWNGRVSGPVGDTSLWYRDHRDDHITTNGERALRSPLSINRT